MGIENTLERIATALEKIADASTAPSGLVVSPPPDIQSDSGSTLVSGLPGIDFGAPPSLTDNLPQAITPPPPVTPSAPPVLDTASIGFGAPPPPVLGLPTNDVALTPSGVELDRDGMPHDERIHSTTKNKTVKGEWKLKRGVDPALVAQVRAEHKIADIPTNVPGMAPTPAGVQQPPPTQSGVQQPLPGAGQGITPWQELVQKIAVAGCSFDLVAAKVQSLEDPTCTTFAQMANRQELWPDLLARLGIR